MRIAGLPPPIRQALLLALPKAAELAGKEDAAPVPQPTVAGHPATSVQMLVAMAATGSGIERRRRIAAESDRGLDALERLHGELIAGPPSAERLQEIAQWQASFAMPDDPQLASIAGEIEMRVLLELAKYDIRA